jgi:hypothetical protein
MRFLLILALGCSLSTFFTSWSTRYRNSVSRLILIVGKLRTSQKLKEEEEEEGY